MCMLENTRLMIPISILIVVVSAGSYCIDLYSVDEAMM